MTTLLGPFPDPTIVSGKSTAVFALLHDHRVIHSLPALLLDPTEREENLTSHRQLFGRQVGRVNAQTGVTRVRVLLGSPAIETPVHESGCRQDQTQLLTLWHGPALVVEAPFKVS